MILNEHNISDCFAGVFAPGLDEDKLSKYDVIMLAKNQILATDSTHTIYMVGDRKFDILGAKHFGMDSIAVLYGYGSQEELSQAGATYFAETAKEIWSYL